MVEPWPDDTLDSLRVRTHGYSINLKLLLNLSLKNEKHRHLERHVARYRAELPEELRRVIA